MKLSLIVSSILAVSLAEAATYTTRFTDASTASACLVKDIGYIIHNTGCTSLKWNADTLKFTTDSECLPIVLQEIREVCGNTVKQNCK
jgi:hypothetical protein